MAIRDGTYEGPEAEMLIKHLEKDDVVLELGGGIGFMSAVAAVRLKSQAVTIVEADPRMLDIIRVTHDLNGTFARVKWGAVSDGNDGSHIEFFERQHFMVSSLTSHESPWIRKYQVPRMSLPMLVGEAEPTFLIIDIEGAEISLFNRVTELGRVSKILIEIHSQLFSDESVGLLNSNIERLGFMLKDKSGLVHFYSR